MVVVVIVAHFFWKSPIISRSIAVSEPIDFASHVRTKKLSVCNSGFFSRTRRKFRHTVFLLNARDPILARRNSN